MAYEAITDAEIQSGKPVIGPSGFGSKVKDNLEYLYGVLGTLSGNVLPNGSFETDSDSDDVPDSWTENLYPGGSGAIYTTSPAHGASSFSFVHPGGAGNGGGYLDSDYVEVSALITYFIRFITWATAAGMKNQVYVLYYDKVKSYISGTAVYSSTTNPTSAAVYFYQFTPPATARFIKVRVIGGYTDTAVAGTAYFDDVAVGPVVNASMREAESVMLPFSDYEGGTEWKSPAVASTTWTTMLTFYVYVPVYATSLTLAVRGYYDGECSAGAVRFKVGALTSSSAALPSSSYAWRTTATLDVSSLSGWQELDIDLQATWPPSDQGYAYFKGYSFVWDY